MTRVLTALALAAFVALPAAALAQTGKPSLMNPASLNEKAPATYKVRFDTSAGEFVVIQVTRAWAPLGADRFYNLVKNGFYDGTRFFRVVPNFMAQWRHERRSRRSSTIWAAPTSTTIRSSDSNKRGYVTFAKTRRAELAIDAGLHQLRRQRVPRQRRLRAVRRGDVGAWRWSTRSTPRQGERAGPGPDHRTKATRTCRRHSPKLDFIKKATIETSRCAEAQRRNSH